MPSTYCLRELTLVLVLVPAAHATLADDSTEPRSDEKVTGWNLWAKGQIVKAGDFARESLAENPKDSGSRHLMVLTSFVNGRYDEGLRHYAQIDPDYDRIKELDQLVLDVYQATRRYDLAVSFAKKAGRPERVIKWLEKQRERPLRVTCSGTTVVPFSQEHLIVSLMPAIPIKINGRDYLGHLDTGGAYIAMSPKMAKDLGIETSYIGEGQANARQTNIEAGIVDSLKIGDAQLENVPTMALSSLQGALQGNGRIEDLVILGTNVLEQFLTTWDNDKQRLVLSPRHDPHARKQHFAEHVSPKAQPMSFYMVPNHYLVGHGSIAGREASFFVDTGLVTRDPQGRQPALTTSIGRLERFGLKPEVTKSTFIDAPGPIRLGPVELANQSIMVRAGSRGFDFGGIKLDALLAHGFLKHCVWTLDFDTRTWYLRQFREPAAIQASKEKVADKNKKKGKKPAPTVNAGALRKYIGTYKSDVLRSEIEVTVSEDRLRFAATGNLRGRFNLKPVAEDSFEAEEAPQKLTLNFELKDDKVTKVSVSVGAQGPFPFSPK